MSAIAKITGFSIFYSAVCSGEDQRKHQSPASVAFVKGIHWSPTDSPHKGPVTREMFPFDDVIIQNSCICYGTYCIPRIKNAHTLNRTNILKAWTCCFHDNTRTHTLKSSNHIGVFFPKHFFFSEKIVISGSWGQYEAHLGPTGPRWAVCWPHEPCYLGRLRQYVPHWTRFPKLSIETCNPAQDFDEIQLIKAQWDNSKIKWHAIDSGCGLAPNRRQAITRNIADLLSILTLNTYFKVIWIKMHGFCCNKMHFKLASVKYQCWETMTSHPMKYAQGSVMFVFSVVV